MPLIATAVGGAVSIGSQIINDRRSKESEQRALKKLQELEGQPVDEFRVTPEQRNVYNLALSDYVNPQGITPAEEQAFRSRIAQGYNTQYSNAVNRAGGQFGKFFSGVLNVGNTNATSDFYAQGSRVRANNRNAAAGRMTQGAGAIQSVSDRNTAAAIQRRMLLEQVYGGAVAQQRQNQSNATGAIGNLGAIVAGYGVQQLGKRGSQEPNNVSFTGDKSKLRYTTPTFDGIDPNYIDPALL